MIGVHTHHLVWLLQGGIWSIGGGLVLGILAWGWTDRPAPRHARRGK